MIWSGKFIKDDGACQLTEFHFMTVLPSLSSFFFLSIAEILRKLLTTPPRNSGVTLCLFRLWKLGLGSRLYAFLFV